MMTLSELAQNLGAELDDAGTDPVVRRVSSIRGAAADTLVFAEDAASFSAALASPAAAVLTAGHLISSPLVSSEKSTRSGGGPKPVLAVAQPRLAFARAAKLLHGPRLLPSVHSTATVSPGAQLAAGVGVGAHAIIETGVRIGAGSMIGSGAVIGEGVSIGARCHIHPRVVIYPGTALGDRVMVHAGAVLGADGFGYVRDQATGEYLQFPQQGTLVLEDDVEIGANTTIDRGALDETRIARGAKIDNLVHIGHNVRIGRNVIIAAQTGISGSCVVEDNAILGGQAGIGEHAVIGEGVILGGQGGILPGKKIRGSGVVFWGTPARPVQQYLREVASLTRFAQSSREKSSREKGKAPPAAASKAAPKGKKNPKEEE